jgi:hypothetical protein
LITLTVAKEIWELYLVMECIKKWKRKKDRKTCKAIDTGVLTPPEPSPAIPENIDNHNNSHKCTRKQFCTNQDWDIVSNASGSTQVHQPSTVPQPNPPQFSTISNPM